MPIPYDKDVDINGISIEFYNNGNIRIIKYYRKGYLHRDNNLPAIINYNETGSISSYKYYYKGEEIFI